jgi:hypothetical protein
MPATIHSSGPTHTSLNKLINSHTTGPWQRGKSGEYIEKMGICPSGLTPEQNQELGNSKLIDRQMREAAERESAKIKLLLLGTGESGKSTLFKQMRILYGNGFSSDDLVRYKWHIWANIIECMRSVCDAVEMFGYGKLITDPKVLEAFKMIKNIQRDSVLELNEEIRENILFLWNDPVVIRTIARRNEFQVCERSQFLLPHFLPPFTILVYHWIVLFYSTIRYDCKPRICSHCRRCVDIQSPNHRHH